MNINLSPEQAQALITVLQAVCSEGIIGDGDEDTDQCAFCYQESGEGYIDLTGIYEDIEWEYVPIQHMPGCAYIEAQRLLTELQEKTKEQE